MSEDGPLADDYECDLETCQIECMYAQLPLGLLPYECRRLIAYEEDNELYDVTHVVDVDTKGRL